MGDSITAERASSPSDAGPDPKTSARRWQVLIVLAAVAFIAQLDVFIVNVAVPAIRDSYAGASLPAVSWVLNAYTVVFAALLVPVGRLADHFGRRRFLLAGVLVFTLGSALCAVSPALVFLIAGRGIQAVGAALIVPTSLGLLYPAFPRSQHALVVGIWAAVQSVAATAGPPIGGLLIGLSWRWIFVINLPIGIAVLLAGRRILPEVRASKGARLPDGLSAAFLLAAVSVLVVVTIQGPAWGWGSTPTIALFAVAAAAAAATVARTLFHPHALIEKTLFVSRPFTISTIAIFLVFVSFSAWLLLTIYFFENEWHYSALLAGLAIAPGPGATAVFAVSARRLAKHLGSAFPAVAGTLLMGGAGVWWYGLAGTRPDYPVILPALLLTGIASGLTQTPLLAAVNTLPADRATTGSAVLNMSRQIGSAIGIALLVALLATSNPHALGEFRQGWILMVISGWGAMAAVIFGAILNRASGPAQES